MSADKPNVIQNIDDMDESSQAGAPQSATFRRGKLAEALAGKEDLAIAAMVVIAAAAVIFLAVRAKPKAASAEEAQAKMQLEATLALLDIPAPVKDHKSDALVTSLYCEGGRRQIPAASLKGNPFIFEPPEPEPESTTQPDDKNTKPRNRRVSEDELVTKAMREARKLSLASVMMGPKGQMALISENLVAKDQKVGVWTVYEIRPMEVILKWRDRTFKLKMRE